RVQVRQGTQILQEFMIEAKEPNAAWTPAQVTLNTLTTFKRGSAVPQSVTFDADVDFADIRVEFLDLDDEDRRGIAVPPAGSGAVYHFDVPATLTVGQYKVRVSQRQGSQ